MVVVGDPADVSDCVVGGSDLLNPPVASHTPATAFVGDDIDGGSVVQEESGDIQAAEVVLLTRSNINNAATKQKLFSVFALSSS